MEYPEGSSLSDDLEGKKEFKFIVEGTPESTENGIANAITAFNRSFLDADSPLKVSKLKISYTAEVEEAPGRATLAYKIQADTDLENFVIGTDQDIDILDLEFRSIEVNYPIVLNSEEFGQIDIARPLGLLEAHYPDFAEKVVDSEAAPIFMEPILDFSLFAQPMDTWHDLFDPSGSLVEASSFFKEESGARAITIYSLGESSFREGTFKEEVKKVTATIGGTQAKIESIVSKPSGQIQIAGFSKVSDYGGETAYVSAEKREGSGSGFTIQVLLVLGGMMGAIAVFILFKTRK
jgi:hypothetical protein